MFHINKGSVSTFFLCLSNDLKGYCRLTGGFRSEHLNNSAFRHAADSQCQIQSDRAGRDCVHIHCRGLPQLHNGAFAELLFNLLQCRLQRFFLFFLCGRHRLCDRCFCFYCHIFTSSAFFPFSFDIICLLRLYSAHCSYYTTQIPGFANRNIPMLF